VKAMRALWVGTDGRVEVRALPEPAPGGPRDVRLRILEVGVCGTDREILEHGFEPPPGSDGIVLGHEALGEVVECGPEVSSVQRGDLVVPLVRVPCPHARCGPCRTGRQDFCVTGDFTERGIKGAHGFMAEQVVLPEAHVVRVPRALRDVAVLVEPLTIAEKSFDQVRAVQERLPMPGWSDEVRPGGGESAGRPRALVLGSGPVGLLGAMALVAGGHRTAVFSRGPPDGPRARLVASFGAEHLSGVALPLAEAHATIEPFDLVYEATGAAQAAFDALPLLAANGVFVLTGIPGHHGPIEIHAARAVRDLVLGNQVLLGTVNAARRHFVAAVRDLALFVVSWPGTLAALVTGRFPLERAPEALASGPGVIKQIVEVPANGSRA
jgi:glucose 1-dehydrogenase